MFPLTSVATFWSPAVRSSCVGPCVRFWAVPLVVTLVQSPTEVKFQDWESNAGPLVAAREKPVRRSSLS
jgi:hypothetical protein